MRILAIDPGNMMSAYTIYNSGIIIETAKIYNEDFEKLIKKKLSTGFIQVVAIEMIASYGMPVGATVFDTCVWIGRFIQIAYDRKTKCEKVYRKSVKMHLCGSMKAKDGNIRQAIIDRYPATGGGKTPQIGIKKDPGPLFGISADMWASLAVAITYDETMKPC